MISIAEKNPVMTNLDSKAFTIKVSGKAFGILIDGLYSDKIGAVVRELAANSWDAHIINGNPEVPFEVTLPTSLNPVFKVRDFGTAMDHDTIMTRYSTLFDSTKDDTNEVVGMLGIGSKSPFAYVTTFGLRSIIHGEALSYIVHLDGEGIPQISCVDKSPTDEPQGFEVSLAVKPGDFRNFETAWAKVALGFVGYTQPIVLGVETQEYANRLVGNGWVVVGGNFDKYSTAIWVRQGCVVYPSKLSFGGGSGRTRIILDVPIGTCSVAANRESLAWDTATEDYVGTVQRTSIKEIEAAVYALVNAETDPLEHARVANEWNNTGISHTLDAWLTDHRKVRLSDFPLQSAMNRDGFTDEWYAYGGKVPKVLYKFADAKPMIRERVRIKAWARSFNGQPTMLGVFRNAREVAHFTKATALVPVHISELLDPGPAARAAKQATVAKLDPAVGEYWTVVTRGKHADGPYASPAYRGWDSLRVLYPNLFFSDVKVHGFTPSAAKQLKLPMERNYLVAVRKQLAGDRDLRMKLVGSYVAQMVATRAISPYAADKLRDMISLAPINRDFAKYNFPWHAAGISQESVEREADNLVSALFAKYPSLDRHHSLTPAEIDVILNLSTTTQKEES